MSGGETNIDQLMNNMNNLSNEENTMVDSIINDLNNNDKTNQPISTQSEMPQISEEEKQMLIQQQQQEQQQMLQNQQLLKQQQLQQQLQQQQQQQQQQQNQINNSFNYKKYLNEYKDGIIIFLILLIFNIESIDELLKFKDYSLFYNFETGSGTFLSILIRSMIISIIFLIIKHLIQ